MSPKSSNLIFKSKSKYKRKITRKEQEKIKKIDLKGNQRKRNNKEAMLTKLNNLEKKENQDNPENQGNQESQENQENKRMQRMLLREMPEKEEPEKGNENDLSYL